MGEIDVARAYLEGRFDVTSQVMKLCEEYNAPTKPKDGLIYKLRTLCNQPAP